MANQLAVINDATGEHLAYVSCGAKTQAMWEDAVKTVREWDQDEWEFSDDARTIARAAGLRSSARLRIVDDYRY